MKTQRESGNEEKCTYVIYQMNDDWHDGVSRSFECGLDKSQHTRLESQQPLFHHFQSRRGYT